MNEPIMRRGLSPEGQRIRQKHQSSLFNDEAGVTSQPLHRKIEKDFLKENVLRLKEIQAKCRVQDSRPKSGSYPVKALLPRVAVISDTNQKLLDQIDLSLSISKPVKQREGSAHSDYYSLSDATEVANESADAVTEPYLYNEEPENFINEEERADDSVTERKESPPISLENLQNQNQFESANSMSCRDLSGPDNFYRVSEPPKLVNQAKRFGDYYPHGQNVRATSKIGSLIEKIKSKKPACETNAKNIWREVEQQHKSLFTYEDAFSIYTPRSSDGSQKSVASLKNKPSSIVSLTRSQSLDRAPNNKENSEQIFEKETVSNSQSADNLSGISVQSVVDQKPDTRHRLPYSFSRGSSNLSIVHDPVGLNQTESMPELSNRQPLEKHKFCFSSTPAPIGITKQQRKGFDTHKKHLQRTENSDLRLSQPSGRISDGPALRSSVQRSNDTTQRNLSSTPVITKRDAPSTQYKQNALAKQRALFLRSKSSSNLHLTGEPPPTYKRGHIPKYLLARKAEAQRQMEAAAAVDPQCPPGHTPLPDHERRNTLHLLKNGQADILRQLSSLPVAQDTLRLRKVRQELETKLNQIDEGIKIFSQPKVYVVNDD